MKMRRLPWNFRALTLYKNQLYRKMMYHNASGTWSNRSSSRKNRNFDHVKRKVKVALVLFAGVGLVFGLGYAKGYTSALNDSKEIIKEGIQAKAAKGFIRDLLDPASSQNKGTIDKAVDSLLGR